MEEILRKSALEFGKNWINLHRNEAKILTKFVKNTDLKKYQVDEFKDFNYEKIEFFLEDFAEFLDKNEIKNKFKIYQKVKEDLLNYDDIYIYIHLKYIKNFMVAEAKKNGR